MSDRNNPGYYSRLVNNIIRESYGSTNMTIVDTLSNVKSSVNPGLFA